MTHARLLLVASALASLTLLVAYLFRDDIFSNLQDPGQPFQTYPKPPAPDYADASSWMEIPDFSVDPASFDAPADVFVVVPEVYKGSESWNLPIDDSDRVAKLRRIVQPNYVEPYRHAGRLFVPYYRQAALYAFLNNRDDSKKAQNLAYQDVRRAFRTFLAHNPPERPIILVGHGQGAAHAQRLLGEFTPRLHRKLAAAFIVGHPYPLQRLEDIPACEDAEATNCVVAWTAIMPGEETRPERLRTRTLTWDGDAYSPVGTKPLLCVNPLSWRADDDTAAADLHKGGVSAVGFEPGLRPTVHRAQVEAKCHNGLLKVSKPKVRSLRRPRILGGKFRTLPSNLFYADLRQNARRRADALIAKDILPKRAPLLETLDVHEVEDAPIIVID